MTKSVASLDILGDNLLRVVAGYYSIDGDKREKIREDYKSNLYRQWVDIKENDNLEEGDRLRRRLYKNSIESLDELDTILKNESAISFANKLFSYRLIKRRSWAKRRVITATYEKGARWKTSIGLDINLEYLNRYAKVISDKGESSPSFFHIPILEVDKREQFIFFDSGDGRGNTVQLSLRHTSAQFLRDIIVGAIAEEYWDDESIPLLKSNDILTTFLGKWFADAADVPGFVKSIEKQIHQDASLNKTAKKELLENLESYENWLEIPDSAKNFMDFFIEELTSGLAQRPSEGERLNEIINQIKHYEKLPVFVYLIALFSFKWIAYLTIPNNQEEINYSLYYSYVLTRDVLQGIVGSEPTGLKKGLPIARGRKIRFPLPMLGQAESEHFTFLPPEGTFFSHYPNKVSIRKTMPLIEQKLASESQESGIENNDSEKDVLPFYIRYRQSGSCTESPVQGDGSLAPEHITTKLCANWDEGEPNRRIPIKGEYPAYNYELICRLRPRLGLRPFVYWLILILSCFYLASLLITPDFITSIQVIPLTAAALGVAASLDKESFLRKQMFIWPRNFIVFAIAIDFIIPWLKYFVVERVDFPVFFIQSIKAVSSYWSYACVCILTILLILTAICSVWLLRHKLQMSMPYKGEGYFDKVQLRFHKRTDRIDGPKLSKYIPHIETNAD